MFENIEWIFFDVGSTIVDEHIAYEHRMKEIADLANTTYSSVYEIAMEFYKQNKKGETSIMMTGELKTKIENIWDIFWSSGMTNPLTVIEQITYLMFIKILDDNELRKEANAAAFDMPVVDPVFDAEHQNCRWHNFRHYEAEAMFRNMNEKVFPFEDRLNCDRAYFGTMLSIAEMLACGTTSFTDMYFFGDGVMHRSLTV